MACIELDTCLASTNQLCPTHSMPNPPAGEFLDEVVHFLSLLDKPPTTLHICNSNR